MNRNARNIALVLACSGLLATSAAVAAPSKGETWGKAGVSFLQYRTDAVECAYEAETKAPVKIAQVDLAFMIDSAQLDANPQQDLTKPNPDINAVLDYAAQSRMRMDRTWREVARQIEPALTSCLTARGYQRLKLTAEQASELKRLRPGARARNVYLWSLAADPGILQAQAR